MHANIRVRILKFDEFSFDNFNFDFSNSKMYSSNSRDLIELRCCINHVFNQNLH